jgi:MFS family permease
VDGAIHMKKLGIFGALIHRDFRLFWLGYVTSVSGMQMFLLVQAWLIYDITGSALQLGFLGLARAVPAVFLGLAGGVFADKVNQRILIMLTTTGVGIAYLFLATLTVTGTVEVWHVLAAVFLTSGLQSFDQASRQSIFPNLIDRRDMTKAVALNSTIHPGTRIVAPIFAGLLIDHIAIPGVARSGAAVAIYLVAICYFVFTYMLYRVNLPPVKKASGTSGLQDLREGIGFVWHTKLFRLLIGMAFVNAFFGMAHVTLLPIFAEKLIGNSSGSGLGLLFSAAGFGGLTGALIGGSLQGSRLRRILIVGGGGLFGVFLTLFALAPWYWLAVALEWLASVSHQLFGVTAQSRLHSQVPDEVRGRAMGIWGMQHSLIQPIGGLSMGVATPIIGASNVVVTSGLIIAIFALAVVAPNKVLNNSKNDSTEMPSGLSVSSR